MRNVLTIASIAALTMPALASSPLQAPPLPRSIQQSAVECQTRGINPGYSQCRQVYLVGSCYMVANVEWRINSVNVGVWYVLSQTPMLTRNGEPLCQPN